MADAKWLIAVMIKPWSTDGSTFNAGYCRNAGVYVQSKLIKFGDGVEYWRVWNGSSSYAAIDMTREQAQQHVRIKRDGNGKPLVAAHNSLLWKDYEILLSR